MLLNVKQKRNKKTGETRLEVTLVGVIDKTYKFTSKYIFAHWAKSVFDRLSDSEVFAHSPSSHTKLAIK